MRGATLMACEFGYGDASFQLAIARAQLQNLPTVVTQASSLTSHAGFQRAFSSSHDARSTEQAKCPLDRTGKMPVLHLCRPVEAEAVGPLNSHIYKLPNKFLTFGCWSSVWRRRKYDNFVCAGSSHQARAVCFAAAFAKHFHLTSNQAFE